MEFLSCNLGRHFKFRFLVFLVCFLPTLVHSQTLPPIIQILEKEPQNLDDVEQLVRFGWQDEALQALKDYPPEDSQVMFLKGQALVGKKRYAAALPFFEDITDPKLIPKAQVRRAVVLSRLKRYDEALAIFKERMSVEKKWGVRDRLRWSSFKTALEAKKYKEGLELLKPVTTARAHWWRGWCHFRLGEFDKTLENWNLIPQRRSFGYYPRALFWKGTLYEQQGLKEESENNFRKLAEKYPENYYGLLAGERLGWEAFLDLSKEEYPLLQEAVIRKESKRRGLDPYFIFGLIHQESRFKETAVSGAGAMGLMQLMPQTALKLVKATHRKNFQWADLFDPTVNIELGSVYLKFLKGLFRNQLPLMIASYNAGEEAVARWHSSRETDPPLIFIEEIPYEETQNYTKKVLANTWIYVWLYEGKLPLLF